MINENISKVRENIVKACEKAGRNPEEVTLIAVSKTKPVSAIEEALLSGTLDYGEIRFRNYAINMMFYRKISDGT